MQATAVKKYVDFNYDLRWVFFYSFKNAVTGIWSRPCSKGLAKASKQDLTGLVSAAIEQRNVKTNQRKLITACTPDEFIRFDWIACAPTPCNLNGPSPNFKITGSINGLTLVTKKHKVECLLNGKINVLPNNERLVYVSNN